MTERAEHERAADLVEVRVIGRRRPTLEREKAERECLEQRVLLLESRATNRVVHIGGVDAFSGVRGWRWFYARRPRP